MSGALLLTRPGLLLRAEALAAVVLAVVLYARLDASWLLFALLILAPDLAALAYLADQRLGTVFYNLAHCAAWPVGLLLLGLARDADLPLALGLIWVVHIAADRLLGYGLKYPAAFKSTHLQRV